MASTSSSNLSSVPLPVESSSMAIVAVSNCPKGKERKKDPNNRKICHQCRQRTMNFMVSCKKMKKDKLCTMQFCDKCLLNRYGLEAKEVDKLEDWTCPKCQRICNCSVCRKQKGQRATGILIHEAKQNGFRSVHELLEHRKGSEALNYIDVPKVPCAATDGSPYKDSAASERSNEDSTNKKITSKKLVCNQTAKGKASDSGAPDVSCEENIVLRQGNPLLEIAGIEFSPEDTGPAFQFLEFCKSFAKVLDIERGQPELILRDIVRGHVGCDGLSSPVVLFKIKLLSLIEKNVNDENWVQALGRRLLKCQCLLENLPGNIFEKGLPGYDSLKQSEKLRFLNFLCHEILETEKLRNYIDEENAKFYDDIKEMKGKVIAIRKEEKILRQQVRQVRDDITNALGGASPISEHDHAITGIRSEADKKHAELLEYIENSHKRKQRSEASGMEPILIEGSGRAYWKLRSYNNGSSILLQDIGTWDSLSAVDKWYFFNEEEEKLVENHVASARIPKRSRPRNTRTVSSNDANEETDATGANLIGDIPLSCPQLDNIDNVKVTMDTRAPE